MKVARRGERAAFFVIQLASEVQLGKASICLYLSFHIHTCQTKLVLIGDHVTTLDQ